MIHRCIVQLQQKAGSVCRLCQVFGVSRSGFYAARQRVKQPQRICPTTVHLQAAFTASGRCYGSRRLSQALKQQGIAAGRHRVRTLMHINGLRPVWKRKFVQTTDSHHAFPLADNLLQRAF